MFEFWLKNEEEDVNLLLPVTPRSYDLSYTNTVQTIQAAGSGAFNLPTYVVPQTVVLDGLFSVEKAHYVNTDTINVNVAMDYVNLITSWIDKKSKIRLIITNEDQVRINKMFFIESINFSEDDTTNKDIKYKITLKERRQLADKAQNSRDEKAMARQNHTIYTVKKGDYLSKIARIFYGDATKWRKIYEANIETIGKNPNLIYPGQKLTMPKVV